MPLFSERSLIADIRQKIQSTVHPDLIRGIGDDCAVLRRDKDTVWLVSVDTLVEDVHFDLAFHPPELLGRKTASVNISDVAAMGGRADFLLVSAALTTRCSSEWIERFFHGLENVCRQYGVVLVGGDTVSSPASLMFSVTVIGSSPADRVICRSGAGAGDLVWVSNFLGEAAAGLELCKRYGIDMSAVDPGFQSLVDAHLNPAARHSLGMKLAAGGLVSAMIDISDGLATDMAHICAESGVGAVIDVKRLPISDALRRAATVLELSALDLALKGGEDYQLLFTAPASGQQEIMNIAASAGEVVHCIGSCRQGDAVVVGNDGRRDISYQGYEHRF